MPKHDAQHTDANNGKNYGSAVSRDNDLVVNGLPSLQDVARDRSNQNTVAGSGGDAVSGTMTRRRVRQP